MCFADLVGVEIVVDLVGLCGVVVGVVVVFWTGRVGLVFVPRLPFQEAKVLTHTGST